MIWVSWPKKASKVPTDITEDVIRDVVLPMGLVDVKVCAVDDDLVRPETGVGGRIATLTRRRRDHQRPAGEETVM